MPSSRCLLRLGSLRRRSWFALPLASVVATSVLAAPVIRPIQRIFAPAPGTDPWAPEHASAIDQPLRQSHGLHAGGFVVFPRLDIRERYDDNIFATENDRASDFATLISPSISVESTWSRHGLGLQAFGVFTRFAEHGTEDSEQGGANLTGRLDITEND